MKASTRRITFFIAYITIAGSLWAASQWWEKGLAQKRGNASISPNGCYRVETFRTFWILPNMFHPMSDPNEDRPPEWFPWWGYPGFYRLYNNHTGDFIGESKIYDLEYASGRLYWGDSKTPEVSAGLIVIGPNLPDCIGDQPARPIRNE